MERKRKEEWPHPDTAESTKGMRPLGTSSAALGTSLPQPFWSHHRYLQPTKQSSVWRLLVCVHSPAQADPVLTLPAQPSLTGGTPRPVQCTSQAPSPPLLFHVLAPTASAAFLHARQPLLHLLLFCPSSVQGLSLGSSLGYNGVLG